jgi:hypothetical protein
MWREVFEASRQAGRAFNIILLLLKGSHAERRSEGGGHSSQGRGKFKKLFGKTLNKLENKLAYASFKK